jgi:hypothetical protein
MGLTRPVVWTPKVAITSFAVCGAIVLMAVVIRREWQRSSVPLVLFAGLFALPLLLHALARQLAW